MKKLLLQFALLIPISFVIFLISASHRSEFATKIEQSSDQNYTIKVMIKPTKQEGKDFANLEDVLLHFTQHPHDAVALTRNIAQATNKYELHKYGFLFKEGKDKNGQFCFWLLANKQASDASQGESIILTQPYDLNHRFQSYLIDPQTAKHQSKHTLSFQSRSGNYLIIPRKGYVSIYDAAQKASDQEIIDFWQHVYSVKQKLDRQRLSYHLNAHAGSHGYQTVPHFHMRFDIR